MDYLNHSKHIPFTHKLYGKAYLMPNSSFNPSPRPSSICYILENSAIIRQSSITDCGIDVSLDVLKSLKY